MLTVESVMVDAVLEVFDYWHRSWDFQEVGVENTSTIL